MRLTSTPSKKLTRRRKTATGWHAYAKPLAPLRPGVKNPVVSEQCCPMPTAHPVAGSRFAVYLLAVLMLLPLLACGGLAHLDQVAPVEGSPGWACPSPTPRPWGLSGPEKSRNPRPTAVPSGPQQDDVEYYAEWEQEYPDSTLRPFPSPTPYVRMGTTARFGQRMRIPPVFALVTATGGAVQADGQQLHTIRIEWTNPTSRTIPIHYGAQVQLTGVTGADGRVATGVWATSSAALRRAGNLPDDADVGLPDTIPPGVTVVDVPILAPQGTPHTVALTLHWAAPPLPPGTPTPTPTPNSDLRAPGAQTLRVQFVNEQPRWYEPDEPECRHPGATTPWDDGAGEGMRAVPLDLPPGASRVVQIALAQQGKPYVWGAKGPHAFDCSGLMTWAYAQVGISIPHGTSGQWPGMRPVHAAAVQPGDLVFFAIEGRGIDHVGMMIGGTRMVHAASPALGIRIDDLNSPYYRVPGRLQGFRTVR
ncbi:C40 family peptidase [Candidatus Viridilinea mediisalina]|uniref:NlpC/P60 domain-containing protein n=1 Tax=Candidatus Viridilinea mediisalina TaxID=2024553 RepID=A0A2A6RER8_9CHLR|nr:C40 family peptidase [Candidatus Viridilinea mediisalina]PDW01178.1 hypothetical protein CJ255_19505 [Candidatus Viridilinea mediisalina]